MNRPGRAPLDVAVALAAVKRARAPLRPITAPRWDAVVVGAGPAGTLAADRLASLGHRVLLLDAGPRPARGERVLEVDRRAWPFDTSGGSFDWFRVRAVGGRAHLWGGWAYRFPARTLERAGWPCDCAALDPLYDELEARLGVVDGRLDDRYVELGRRLGLSVLPKRGALGRRGLVWTPLEVPVARRARVHRVALRLEHGKGIAEALRTLSLATGRESPLRARAYVLAASPIETARILLASDLGPKARAVGRNLVDHMVASYVLVEPAPPPPLAGRGPFPGAALVESFVNLDDASARPYRGGFSIELGGPTSLEEVNLERMVPGDEVARHRATQIHALGELFPHRARFVDLDAERRDQAGAAVARVHVAWTRAEERMARDLRTACTELADALALPGSRLVPVVDPLQAGAGHEAGTCAMGPPERAACDEHGRLRALDNVWIADASALPTAGDRHPTLTLLAHALRAADDVARHLARAR
jgi:choline dehydrogenase-like flavoprotein